MYLYWDFDGVFSFGLLCIEKNSRRMVAQKMIETDVNWFIG